MNKHRWNAEVPTMVLGLKLCEEAAEVGTEISDAWMKLEVIEDNPARVRRILTELDHVQHFVDTLRKKFTETPLTN